MRGLLHPGGQWSARACCEDGVHTTIGYTSLQLTHHQACQGISAEQLSHINPMAFKGWQGNLMYMGAACEGITTEQAMMLTDEHACAGLPIDCFHAMTPKGELSRTKMPPRALCVLEAIMFHCTVAPRSFTLIIAVCVRSLRRLHLRLRVRVARQRAGDSGGQGHQKHAAGCDGWVE